MSRAYFRSLPAEGEEGDARVWVPTDTKLWMQPPQITPIESVGCEPLKMQLYLEHPSPTEPKNSEA
jgi:mitotic spindle assembly checkpoint protein MAD2B